MIKQKTKTKKAGDDPAQQPEQESEPQENKKKDNDIMKKLARCPLCVEQGITVPVDAVEYTDNGVKIKATLQEQGAAKAAPSVLKWGGGHAANKKQRRRQQKQKQKQNINHHLLSQQQHRYQELSEGG
jgi:hypothetical protein